MGVSEVVEVTIAVDITGEAVTVEMDKIGEEVPVVIEEVSLAVFAEADGVFAGRKVSGSVVAYGFLEEILDAVCDKASGLKLQDVKIIHIIAITAKNWTVDFFI